MEETARHDPVHAAAGPQHRRGGRPGPRLRIEDFVGGGQCVLQPEALTPADEVDPAVDGRAGEVVARGGQLRQHLPGVARRIVDGEVAFARRASAGDVNPAIVHHGRPGMGRRRLCCEEFASSPPRQMAPRT